MSTFFDVPFSRFIGDLNLKKVAIVSVAGILKKNDHPQETEEFILIPSDTPASDLTITHHHINPSILKGDINALFPIDRFRELEDEGKIGGPTSNHVSVFGFHLLQSRIRREVAPKIAEVLESDDAGAVLFLSGCIFCNRIAIGIQTVVEDWGIPTVAITQHPIVTRMGHPPRAFYPTGLRPGHAVGLPNRPDMQKEIIMEALNLLRTVEEPGLVIEKSYSDYTLVQ